MQKQQRIQRWLLAMILMISLLVIPVQVLAENNVPSTVLDARAGVLRILTVGEEDVYTGTGFAVGSENRLFIVTNYHVIEDSQAIYVFYDSGKYVTASIHHSDPSRDLCVLKADGSMPRVQPLKLETNEFDSGIGVYALGFPAAADYFSQDMNEEFNSAKEFLASIKADKKTMTITDGIVSAFHNSNLIGDGSRSVEVLQTNTALNGGNSGGPLLNNDGRVVGVNTIGISMADSINGAVHVEELIRVLRDARVRYESNAQTGTGQQQEDGQNLTPMYVIVSLMGLVAVGGVVAALLVAKRQKRMPVKGGVTLEEFEHSYRKIEEVATLEMTLRFVEGLLPLAQYDLNPLFTPTNVIVGDNAIALKKQSANMQPGVPPVYPGYTAPEVMNGRSGPAATVYFIGAMMYTLLTGHRPPDARQRVAENTPAFPNGMSIQALVNRAMEPYEQNRIGDLYQLAAALQQEAGRLRQF